MALGYEQAWLPFAQQYRTTNPYQGVNFLDPQFNTQYGQWASGMRNAFKSAYGHDVQVADPVSGVYTGTATRDPSVQTLMSQTGQAQGNANMLPAQNQYLMPSFGGNQYLNQLAGSYAQMGGSANPSAQPGFSLRPPLTIPGQGYGYQGLAGGQVYGYPSTTQRMRNLLTGNPMSWNFGSAIGTAPTAGARNIYQQYQF